MSGVFTAQRVAQKRLRLEQEAECGKKPLPSSSFPSEGKKKSSEMQPGGNTTLVCHPVTCTSHPSTETSFAVPLTQQSVAFILSSVTLLLTWLSFPLVFICSSPTQVVMFSSFKWLGK